MLNAGIYIITNNIDQRVYVGSTNSFTQRKNRHFFTLKNNKHANPYLQNFVNKYGIESLQFQTLEFIEDEQTRLDKEQYWIDHFKQTASLFNVGLVVRAPRTGIKHTEETRKKLSFTHKGVKRNYVWTEETRKKLSTARRGKKPLEDWEIFSLVSSVCLTISRNLFLVVSEQILGRFLGRKHSQEELLKMRNRKHTEEELLKIRLEAAKKCKPVFQFSLVGTLIKRWDSAIIAGKELGLNKSGIQAICRGEGKSLAGYRWSYDQ